tara:strand:+ start:2482 stop:3159 length:678 start_codon:yes stop_codon:yes gene_type:complete
MSLIGTMYKEPRVFAHDAYALSDLKKKYGIIDPPPYSLNIRSQGVDYSCANGATDVRTQGGSGSGLTVDLTVNPATGGVSNAAVNNQGFGYLPGDIVSIDADCGKNTATLIINPVDIVTAVAWAFGDPLTIKPGPKTDISFYGEKTQYSYTFGKTNYVNPGPPAALYIGVDMDISVIMEASNSIFDGTTKVTQFKGVKAGTVLPFSVLTVTNTTAGTLDDVVALW